MRYLLIGVIIFIVEVVAIAAGWHYLDSQGVSSGDVFSLGQLIIDAVLLPTAIIGFLFTIEEVRKAQKTFKLSVAGRLSGGNEGLTYKISGETNSEFFELLLINTGNSVCVWYAIDIQIPLADFDIFKNERDHFYEDNYEWLLHTDTGNYIFHKLTTLGSPALSANHWREQKTDGLHLSLTFDSHGKIATYPNQDTVLSKVPLFKVDGSVEQSATFHIEYAIYTNTEDPVMGTTSFEIHP